MEILAERIQQQQSIREPVVFRFKSVEQEMYIMHYNRVKTYRAANMQLTFVEEQTVRV